MCRRRCSWWSTARCWPRSYRSRSGSSRDCAGAGSSIIDARVLHDQLRHACLLARHHLAARVQRHIQAFPISGFGSGFIGHLYYLFLPALTIALGFSTVLVRSLRASTIATMQAEFVDTAGMKGISRARVLPAVPGSVERQWRNLFLPVRDSLTDPPNEASYKSAAGVNGVGFLQGGGWSHES